jgi:hypothetical protein
MIEMGIYHFKSQKPMFQFSSQSDVEIQSYWSDNLGTEFGN